MCLSILPASLYFFNSRRRTRIRLIHCTLVGNRASAVPFLLPAPVCRPLRLAARRSLVRDREWIVVGFTIMCPSLINFATPFRELALAISAASWGSSQTIEREGGAKWSAQATLRRQGPDTTTHSCAFRHRRRRQRASSGFEGRTTWPLRRGANKASWSAHKPSPRTFGSRTAGSRTAAAKAIGSA